MKPNITKQNQRHTSTEVQTNFVDSITRLIHDLLNRKEIHYIKHKMHYTFLPIGFLASNINTSNKSRLRS